MVHVHWPTGLSWAKAPGVACVQIHLHLGGQGPKISTITNGDAEEISYSLAKSVKNCIPRSAKVDGFSN